jgi:hypothetical protein
LFLLCYIQLYGPTSPIPHLSVANDLTLTALPAGGFITTTEGSFAGFAVSAAASITQQQGVFATLTAATPTVKQLGPLVDVLLGQQQQLPQTLLDFIKPMQFSKVTVAYSSAGVNPAAAAAAPGAFALMAVPSIDGAPKLKQIASSLGLGVTDFALSSTGAGLSLSMTDSFELQLPAPFTRTGPTLLSMNQDSNVLEAVLSGSFSGSIKLPGIAAAVPLQLATGVSLRKHPIPTAASGSGEGVALQLSSLVMRPLALDKFGFVQFEDVRLSAAANYGPSSLSKMVLSAPVTVFGVEAPSSFVYDR